ncbi:MAG: glycine cleavage system protein H [Anaerolineales bacterium]|nr:glycine cleavage system protein H [Anaerolineales bacterium]
MSNIQEFKIGADYYTIPADRFYGREDHMWALYDHATGNVTIGMDALGLAALGDLAYVSLQPVGTTVSRGETLGTLEAAKMTGDLTSPISGEIVERNDLTIRNPALVNEETYTNGWLVIIKPSDWESESKQLVSTDELPVWVESELTRYRQQGWID